jgi:hypothetical protein
MASGRVRFHDRDRFTADLRGETVTIMGGRIPARP